MKPLLIVILSVYTFFSFGQEIEVRSERFPGISKIIVKSTQSGISRIIPLPFAGYWAEYFLDEKGQIKVEKRHKRKEHLATFEYEFSNEGLLTKQITTYDINHPKRSEIFKYDYIKNNGSTIREVCYKDSDTLYQIENLEFNDEGLRTKYLNNKNETLNYLTYNGKNVSSWRSISLSDSSEMFYEFDYDINGNMIKLDLKRTPELKSKIDHVGIRGEKDHIRYKYKYDRQKRWIKKYQIIGRRKVFVEKRKYII